jgi:DNA-binding NtrC family response regulator
MTALTQYDWPGNVRELRNLVDGLVALRPETKVGVSDLPAHIVHGGGAERALPVLPRDRGELEREFMMQSLLAIRAEVAAIRDLLSGRFEGHKGAPFDRDDQGYPSGGAVYPSGPVRIEDSGSLSLEELERRAVERALHESGDNRRKAAQALGISERTLYRRIKQFGLAGADEDAISSRPVEPR